MFEGDWTAKKYVLERELGAGGMGVVYRATHAHLGRPVAIKIVRPELTEATRVRERFHHEAIAAARCAHRNVIPILDYDEDHGRPYLVMPLVRGHRLGTSLARSGPWPLRRIKNTIAQLLSALATTHARGVVHGDVKSDNVLVTTRGEHDHVVLIDYGLARLPDQPRSDLTGMVSGTPEYLAPEVIDGAAPTPASDLYGVGIILFQLLVGRTPFVGGSADVVLARQCEEPVPPLAELCPQRKIPHELEQLVRAALVKDPRDRIRRATAFRSALATIRISRDDEARCPSLAIDTDAVTLDLDRERERARDATPTAVERRPRGSTRDR